MMAAIGPVIPDARGAWKWWLLAFVAALSLYVATSNRGVQWQDSGWQQYRILTGSIEHPLGLALTHPLQFFLGRLFVLSLPIEPAWATTLVSALAGAIGVANLVLLIRLTTGVRIAAVLSGLSLMLAHTYWQYATLTESYTLVVALLTSEWLCWAMFVRTRHSGWLVLLAGASGLGVANHMLAALAIPINALAVIAVVLRERKRAWLLLVTPLVGLLALAPYGVLVVQSGLASGDWAETLRSAAFGRFQNQVLNASMSLRQLSLAAGYVIYNFADLTLLAALIGWRWPAGAFAVLKRIVLTQGVLYLLFALRYDIVDQYTFFIPSYAALAVLSGWGWAWCAAKTKQKYMAGFMLGLGLLLVAIKPLTYYEVAEFARQEGLFQRLVRNAPYRDGYASYFLPWSVSDRAAEEIVTQAAELAGPHSVILTEISMVHHALLYARATGRLPEGVTIGLVVQNHHPFEDKVREALRDGDAVILVPRDRDQPRYSSLDGVWLRAGDLYVLDTTLVRR